MNCGNVFRIMTYFVSSLITVGAHSSLEENMVLHILSQRNQYCYYLYSANRMCLTNFQVPTHMPEANTFNNLPRWDSNGRSPYEHAQSVPHKYQIFNPNKSDFPSRRSFHNLPTTLFTNTSVLPIKKTSVLDSHQINTHFIEYLIKNLKRLKVGNDVNKITKITSILPIDTSRLTTRRVDNPLRPLRNSTNYVQSTESSTSATTLNELDIELARDSNEYSNDPGDNNSQNNFSYGRGDGTTLNGTAQSNNKTTADFLYSKFRTTLFNVERRFLLSVFTKLTAISPDNRKENGISFLQSGVLLHQLLMALSIETDLNRTQDIEDFFGLKISAMEKVEILKRTMAWLPKSSDVLKFRWASRLVLRHSLNMSSSHQRAASAMGLQFSWLNGNETAADITEHLNNKVLTDSGGTMHDTFEEEELSAGLCAAALGTGYVRATWRVAPTLLNGSLPFHDAPTAPNRSSRFFRLNDLMGYAYLHEWDAEAIEIQYATPGLSLLLLVPRQPSLRPLVERAAATGLGGVLGVMHTLRLAVTLPLYTLRMTLLLPNKLQDMGMPNLVTNDTDCNSLKFSHAVQRLMFWAEAGRNAYKDDGIEWDPRPELEIIVNRPYLFFIRWENVTLMNGAFVL